jgi:hypothetical protein
MADSDVTDQFQWTHMVVQSTSEGEKQDEEPNQTVKEPKTLSVLVCFQLIWSL